MTTRRPNPPPSPSPSPSPSIYSGSTARSSDKEQPPPHRGLRQKARDVVSDLGAPPTARQDAKDGTRTFSHAVDAALMAGLLSAPVKI